MISTSISAQAATFLAQAAPAGQQQGQGPFLIMMVLMFVMMYFLLIRPQRRKQKETEVMQKAIAAGDEVVTIGGAHGVVTSLKENTVIVRMNEGKIEFDRSAIARRVSKSDAAAAAEEPKK